MVDLGASLCRSLVKIMRHVGRPFVAEVHGAGESGWAFITIEAIGKVSEQLLAHAFLRVHSVAKLLE